MPDAEGLASVEAEDEAEAGDEEEGEAEDIRESLIVRGENIDFEYPLGVLAVGEGADRKFVATCAIGESSEGSIIVAFPGKCWNRAAAKRVIGLDLVRKVSAVRASCASLADRRQALDSELRVCIGILTVEGEAAFDFVRDFETDIDVAYSFGTAEQPELLPHAGALADLAQSTFEFLTAQSAGGDAPTGSGAQRSRDVESRLERLEGCFLSIQADLKKLVSTQAADASGPPAPAPARPKSKPQKPANANLEGMDPGVVKAALDSGIDIKHIEEMGKFLRGQAAPMTDEPKATARAKFARQTRLVDDELDDEDPEDEPDAPEVQDGDPIKTAVSKLTAIAAQLAEGKKKETSLEAILDGSGSGEATTSGTTRIGDALREERYEEAYLRSLLGLAAGDQLSIDKGSWNVAGEVLLEDPPPFTSFTSHTLPSGAEVPFTKLVDARWMEIFMARLREVDLYLETRRKLGGGGSRRGEDGGAPPQRTDAEETPTGPKKPPKGRGRGSKGASASEEK
ncbi:unnamed protein product [Symbiodinium necroappetens]|uniref:Uncharacterized protein n=1 Tax=Symbiodinium necroappetens TaxID=1628268 RepID=A0A812V2R4_9DINO|nr:unnamed protein product [Symbiodinium necroappetens]